jgi:hypothetical protein
VFCHRISVLPSPLKSVKVLLEVVGRIVVVVAEVTV